jgi:hypothetical protein
MSSDELPTNLTLYCVTAPLGFPAGPATQSGHGARPVPAGAKSACRWAMSSSRREIMSPPRLMAQRGYTGIELWTFRPKGSHLAALEQPGALTREIGELFKPLRR